MLSKISPLLSMNIPHTTTLLSYTALVRKPAGRPRHPPGLSAQPPTILHLCPEKGGPFSPNNAVTAAHLLYQSDTGRTAIVFSQNLSKLPLILGSIAVVLGKSAAKAKGNCLRNCLLVNQKSCAVVRRGINACYKFLSLYTALFPFFMTFCTFSPF